MGKPDVQRLKAQQSEYVLEAQVPERRRTPRLAVRTIHAWISGPVRTPAAVRDMSLDGALIAPLLPLRHGQLVWIEFMSATEALGSRKALVVRIGGDSAGLCFE